MTTPSLMNQTRTLENNLIVALHNNGYRASAESDAIEKELAKLWTEYDNQQKGITYASAITS
ncbi:hypothetical protein [Vibrio fluvialis]|uniref:hypothetical protein n=1 Tax=Vibrio fluvialis TaxID=676 RepID=UPI0028F6F8EC|nr:hypothetical protein [Vibrio fluvialis]